MASSFVSGLLGGLVAAAVSMLGWFVSDHLRRRSEQEREHAEYVEAQISELYAPLSIYSLAERRYRMMRDRAVEAAPSEMKAPVWREFSERYVIPEQMKIFELFKTKWHLLIFDRRHDSYQRAIEHCTDALSLFDLDVRGVKGVIEVDRGWCLSAPLVW